MSEYSEHITGRPDASPDPADIADFADAARGFIASLPELVIRTASGTPVWDLTPYAFLNPIASPPTVNPSLWRMARLNLHHGLFQVTEQVFQVRGLDLANLTIIESDTGVISSDQTNVPIIAPDGSNLHQWGQGDCLASLAMTAKAASRALRGRTVP
jgi:alkyl sulfatase BDS1-like metallo-beta-lactamase superfamily hydrolase